MLHYSFRSKEHYETLLTIFWRFFMTRTNECKISRSSKEHQREPIRKLKASSDSCCRNESNTETTSVQLCQAFDFIKPWRLKAVFYAVKIAPRNIYRFNPHLVIYWRVKQVLNLFDNGFIKIRHLPAGWTLQKKMDFLFAQKNPIHDVCQIVALVPLAMRRTKS